MTGPDKYISMRDAVSALKCSRARLHHLRESGAIKSRRVENSWDYLLSSLPAEAQEEYWIQHPTQTTDAGTDSEIYATAPQHARRKADKYLQVLSASGAITGAALKVFIAQWNRENPSNTTSYPRLLAARKEYAAHGVSALLGKWGKRSAVTSVPDNLFAYFKALYLSDGRPSVVSCWKITLGHAVATGTNPTLVPSHSAFLRRLKKDTPEQAIYTAREGAAAANKRYGFYIRRNYTDVLAGECWISDHAQLDVAATYNDNGKTKVGYPWITAWRDFKSGFWTGWNLHMESPDSNYIFDSFYRGAVQHGIPETLYLDNGKDYRVKDFTGGRRYHKLYIEEGKATALTAALGITTIFAWPYNAQSKSIERDFNRNKEWFSKHNPGYRGGNVVERPEDHNKTIASGKILSIEELEPLLDDYINNVMMLSQVSSGYRKGKCPLQLWEDEYPQAIEQGKVRHVSKTALMLFCTRVSGVATISRRGVRDGKLGVDYYAPWMEGQRGRKVYLRRDVKMMQEAWVFDAATDTYLDNAYLLPEVGALATTDIAQSELKKHIAIKRNSNKLIKILSRPDYDVPFNEKMAALTTATRVLNEMDGYQPGTPKPDTKAPLLLTNMDKVFAQREANKKEGTFDLSELTKNVQTGIKRRKLAVFESDLPDAVNF